MSDAASTFVIVPAAPGDVPLILELITELAEYETLAHEVEATEPDYPVYLTVDGRDPLRLETGAIVRITKAAKTLPLAVMPDTSFFGVVRQKLKWSGSNV